MVHLKYILIMTSISKITFCLLISGLLLTFDCSRLFAAPLITIENIADSPETFSPDGDGVDDRVIISADIGAFGFNSRKPLTAACSVAITGINGPVKTLSKKITLANNSKSPVSFQWDGKNKQGAVSANGTYRYSITVVINNQTVTSPEGDIVLFIPAVLSVSVNPGFWNIGQADVNTVVTMTKSKVITVTNDGNTVSRYSLNLINPPGWEASQEKAGKDTYILNAAFSRDLRRIIWSEANHALSVIPALSSNTRFAGDQTGVSVRPGAARTLWMQFKSPSSTMVSNMQEMRVIITAGPE